MMHISFIYKLEEKRRGTYGVHYKRVAIGIMNERGQG
jgi:hypothetical protein